MQETFSLILFLSFLLPPSSYLVFTYFFTFLTLVLFHRSVFSLMSLKASEHVFVLRWSDSSPYFVPTCIPSPPLIGSDILFSAQLFSSPLFLYVNRYSIFLFIPTLILFLEVRPSFLLVFTTFTAKGFPSRSSSCSGFWPSQTLLWTFHPAHRCQ